VSGEWRQGARRLAMRGVWAAPVAAVLMGLALVFAPYVFAELLASLEPHVIIDSVKPELGEGRKVDDYWAVEDIGVKFPKNAAEASDTG
jgi:hypothetical protein